MDKNKKSECAPKSRTMTLTIKAVVLNEKNEVLILRRSKDNKYSVGKYDLPGGHIEENEGLKDSVLREIKEETGLVANFGEIIDVVEFPEDSPQFKEEKRGLRCICYVETSEVELSFEHDEFKWVALDNAQDEFSEKDGFEKEKRNTIIKAQKYLEMKEATDRWKRTMADFENYKQRQLEERKEMMAFSNLNLISEIIPVLDNFHASTDHIPPDQKDNAWVVGIMHIQSQLEKVLEDNGVSEIAVKVGDDFDPQTMEALSNSESEEKEFENIVNKIVQKGYRMGPASSAGKGRIVRATRVIVE